MALPSGSGGLAEGSVALCHQVTTLDRAKLTAYVGALDPAQPHDLADGHKVALDLS